MKKASSITQTTKMEQNDIVSQCSPNERKTMNCLNCDKPILPPQRHSRLGYQVCLDCGDKEAKTRKFTIAPINKSNYMLITDLTQLKQLNPKRTT